MMFDYGFETTRRYIRGWSNRLAQIEAMGQEQGEPGKPGHKPEAFGTAIKMAGDDYTKETLGYFKMVFYNQYPTTGWGKISAGTGTALTGMHLGNPETSLRNFYSGQAVIATQYGLKTYAKAVWDTFRGIPDAHEKGVIAWDLMNIAADAENVDVSQGVRTFTDLAMRWGGGQAAENLNRTVNLAAARSFLRTAVAEYNKDPTSSRTRAFFGHIKRLGLNPQALIDENQLGRQLATRGRQPGQITDRPLTDRFLRQSVIDAQGGYGVDQIPAFQGTPNGRFWFKYIPWGTQHMRWLEREVAKPALRAMTFGTRMKESVEIRNPVTGNMETHQVPGELRKLIMYGTAMTAGGAAAVGTISALFGKKDTTATFNEILVSMNENTTAALGALLQKMWYTN